MTAVISDDPSWDQIQIYYLQLRGRLVVRLFYLLRSRHDAEDVAQEAFIRAARNWHALRRTDSKTVEAWLNKIAANLAMDMLRQRKQRREVMLDDSDAVREFISARVAPELAYEVSSAMDMLDRLSDRQRHVYLLRHYFGFKVAAIARHLDIDAGTARTHLHRAQKTINTLTSRC